MTRIAAGTGFLDSLIKLTALSCTLTGAFAVSAEAAPGACCLPDESCVEVEHNDCVSQSGEPFPAGSSCGATSCSVPVIMKPPTFGDPPLHGCLDAWSDLSVFGGPQIVAAHFSLPERSEVSIVKWWGLYQVSFDSVPPPDAPPYFHLVIWSSEPPTPDYAFHRPGDVLAHWFVERSSLSEGYVGCALDRSMTVKFGSTFKYSYEIPEGQRFTAEAGTSYWLSIAAVFGIANCPCLTDVAEPFGSCDPADVDFVESQIGCTVGAGDPSCDVSDVNCDGVVDMADRDATHCQYIAACFHEPCCFPMSEYPWEWVVRPLEAGPTAVRIFSPTYPLELMYFGEGEPLWSELANEWDVAFVMFAEPAAFVVPSAPVSDGSGVNRNRYLAFQAPASWADQEIALRVTLQSLDGFSGFDGEVRWAGSPQAYPDDPNLGSTFPAAVLQCDPTFVNWDTDEPSYLIGVEVVPNSVYRLQAVDVTCQADLANESCYSSALEVVTDQWGDVVSPFGGESQPNFGDITAIVDKFKDLASAISKTRAQLQPNLVNPLIAVNFADIAAAVEAFKGSAYSYAGPVSCP